MFPLQHNRYMACFGPFPAIVSLRCGTQFRGRERCDTRLSYSNIGDEQLTIYVAAFAGAEPLRLAALPR